MVLLLKMHDVLLLGGLLVLPTRVVETVIEVITVVAVDGCNVVMIEREVLLVDLIVTVVVEPDDAIVPLDVL
jgi:hypothetical protein